MRETIDEQIKKRFAQTAAVSIVVAEKIIQAGGLASLAISTTRSSPSDLDQISGILDKIGSDSYSLRSAIDQVRRAYDDVSSLATDQTKKPEKYFSRNYL